MLIDLFEGGVQVLINVDQNVHCACAKLHAGLEYSLQPCRLDNNIRMYSALATSQELRKVMI